MDLKITYKEKINLIVKYLKMIKLNAKSQNKHTNIKIKDCNR